MRRASASIRRALTNDLIDQRRRASRVAPLVRAAISRYCEQGCTFPASVATPAIA
jgi:hypothetical protein